MKKYKKVAALGLSMAMLLAGISYPEQAAASQPDGEMLQIETGVSTELETPEVTEVSTEPATPRVTETVIEPETPGIMETPAEPEIPGVMETPVEPEIPGIMEEPADSDTLPETGSENNMGFPEEDLEETPEGPSEETESIISEAAKAVQEMLDALPPVDALDGMDREEQNAVSEQVRMVYEAYEALTEEEKEQVTGAEVLETFLAFFNSQNNASEEDTGDFIVTGGTYGIDYKFGYSFGKGMLDILTSKELTITTNGKPTSHGICGRLTPGITYNLVFQNLYINGEVNGFHGLFINTLNLTIVGTNKIDVSTIGLNATDIVITAESTGSLEVKGSIWDLLIDSNIGSGNLEVNGGSLKAENNMMKGSISTSGTGTFNDKKYVAAPAPSFTTTQTASSITVEVTNYQEDYGEIKYQWDNGEWGRNATLSNLGHNQEHTVSVCYMGNGDNYTQSESATSPVQTNPAVYTITIPATADNPLVAGEENSTSTISVAENAPFDLGYNGQVDVKIKQNDMVTENAELILTRQDDPAEYQITSALLVNKKELGDIDQSVATFKAKDDEKITISFAPPAPLTADDKIIPAGTYNGTITFESTYSELSGGTQG